MLLFFILLLLMMLIAFKTCKEKYEYPDKEYAYAIQNDIPYGGSVYVTPGYQYETPGLGWIL